MRRVVYQNDILYRSITKNSQILYRQFSINHIAVLSEKLEVKYLPLRIYFPQYLFRICFIRRCKYANLIFLFQSMQNLHDKWTNLQVYHYLRTIVYRYLHVLSPWIAMNVPFVWLSVNQRLVHIENQCCLEFHLLTQIHTDFAFLWL